MTMMLLDGALVFIIAWGVWYAWKTNASMQSVKNEMKPVARQLGSYLNTIGQHLYQLKETTENNRRVLSEQLPQAQTLRDDFEVLLEHGNRLAERLDALLDQAYAVEKDLRSVGAGLVRSSSHRFGAGQQTEETEHQQDLGKDVTGVVAPTRPAQNIYVPYTNTTIPYPTQPQSLRSGEYSQPYPHQESLDQARERAMQTRSEVASRLRGGASLAQ